MAKYEVEELPPVSKWKKLKWQLTPYLYNTEWVVFDTGLRVAKPNIIESSYLSGTLRDSISGQNPKLVFVRCGDVLKLASVPLKSGHVYGIRLYKGVNLQNPAVYSALTDAITMFVEKNGVSPLLVLPGGEAAKRTLGSRLRLGLARRSE
jgi:hypothetical protein